MKYFVSVLVAFGCGSIPSGLLFLYASEISDVWERNFFIAIAFAIEIVSLLIGVAYAIHQDMKGYKTKSEEVSALFNELKSNLERSEFEHRILSDKHDFMVGEYTNQRQELNTMQKTAFQLIGVISMGKAEQVSYIKRLTGFDMERLQDSNEN